MLASHLNKELVSVFMEYIAFSFVKISGQKVKQVLFGDPVDIFQIVVLVYFVVLDQQNKGEHLRPEHIAHASFEMTINHTYRVLAIHSFCCSLEFLLEFEGARAATHESKEGALLLLLWLFELFNLLEQ